MTLDAVVPAMDDAVGGVGKISDTTIFITSGLFPEEKAADD